MQGEIRQEDDFKRKDDARDVIWLLNTIRGVMFKFRGKNHYLSMNNSRSALNWLYQDLKEKTAVFYDCFVSMVDDFENYSGTIGGEDELT